MPLKSLSEVIEAVHAAYPTAGAEMVEPLITFLLVGRDLVGDSEKVLLLLVIGVRTKQDPAFALYSTEALESGALPLLPSLGINTRSLAESTGIPRETVRRKLSELVQAGVLARAGRDFRYTAQGYRAVHAAREAIETMVARHYQTALAIVDKSLDGAR